ncbi:MAG: hypothetical protein MZV64_34555 [Ignavibacteriales bacterium]|nr:hypothetical protein [Ignavibacteriales bacterium]
MQTGGPVAARHLAARGLFRAGVPALTAPGFCRCRWARTKRLLPRDWLRGRRGAGLHQLQLVHLRRTGSTSSPMRRPG